MGLKTAKNYSPEFREQIIKECMETNKYNVVAKKHQVPVTTVYTWINRDKNKAKGQKALGKEFANGGGYQKLTHYLKRDFKYTVNSKKIYRLCQENDLLLPKKEKRKKPKSQRCVNRVISRPHQMWELDLKYGFIHGENRFFYILVIIDVCLRLIITLV